MRSNFGRRFLESRNDPPIDLRFIDLFMAGIGALVFMALLLSVIIPNVSSGAKPIPSEDITLPPSQSGSKDYEAENEILKSRINELTSQIKSKNSSEQEQAAKETAIDNWTTRIWALLVVIPTWILLQGVWSNAYNRWPAISRASNPLYILFALLGFASLLGVGWAGIGMSILWYSFLTISILLAAALWAGR